MWRVYPPSNSEWGYSKHVPHHKDTPPTILRGIIWATILIWGTTILFFRFWSVWGRVILGLPSSN